MQTENPYQSPQSVEGLPTAPPSDEKLRALREIAVRQRMIPVAILAFIVGNLAPLIMAGIDAKLLPFAALFMLAMFLFAAINVARLASKLSGSLAGFAYGILASFPCLGLISLLDVGHEATKKLEQAGIKVGLLGANMNQFPRDA